MRRLLNLAFDLERMRQRVGIQNQQQMSTDLQEAAERTRDLSNEVDKLVKAARKTAAMLKGTDAAMIAVDPDATVGLRAHLLEALESFAGTDIT